MLSRPLSSISTGKRNDEDGGKKTEPSTQLGLEIGDRTEASRSVIKQEMLEIVFTAAQLHELHIQISILKHFEAGLLLPFTHFLPVSNRVCCSLGTAEGGIYNNHPCFEGFSSRELNSRKAMDPEPGRCRRTDGKKWRCYRRVVTGQKYCERHMYRGCQRSRKLVEGSEKNLISGLPTANANSASPFANSTNSTNSKGKVDHSAPRASQLAFPATNFSSAAPFEHITSTSGKNASSSSIYDLPTSPVTVISHSCRTDCNDNERVGVSNKTSSTSTSTEASLPDNETGKRSYSSTAKGFEIYHSNVGVVSRKIQGKEGCFPWFNGPVFGLSPKSVLQSDGSCRSLGCDYKKKVTEMDQHHRCRRTDGKRWRCSRDVVHGQKYCEKHMHRGAKRVVATPNTSTMAPAAPATCDHCPFFVAQRANTGINLNTNPSPSMAACPMPEISVDSTSSSSSSDATTVTD